MTGETSLVVNGRETVVTSDESFPLLSVLREELGLLGARTGCGIGECGSCTVLVDGAPTRSCITPLSSVAGASVTTPEGLGTPAAPGPVQQAFLDEQAAQCGFCINGMIMSTSALSDSGDVDAAAIARALDEHICRCGTQLRILRAARRATAAQGSEPGAGDREPARSLVIDAAQDVGTQPLRAVPVGSRVEERLRILDDGRIEVLVGKVELGQGIRTAFAQIAAAELGLPVACVVVRSASTARGPDDGYTSGSGSLEDAGIPLAAAAVAFRRLLLQAAGEALDVPADELRLDADGVVVSGDGRRLPLATLAARGDVVGRVESTDVPAWGESPLGVAVARDDLVAKLTGAPAFVHDMALPGMLHARAMLPPTYEAKLLACDLDPAIGSPGVAEVVRDGNYVLVLAERSPYAVRAVERLAQRAAWDDPGLGAGGDEWLQGTATDVDAPRSDPWPPPPPGAIRLAATYTKPYEAHGPVAPSCGVALEEDGHLTVWTHSQGIYALRAELAAFLDRDPDSITVEHRDGPGCYGHNAADDAAAFAALAALRVPGRAVRFQFSVDDEFAWEPYGSAMEASLEASLDPGGALTAWRHHARTDVHHARPDGAGDRLIPAWLRAEPRLRPRPKMGDPGTRNAVPLYDIPAMDVRADFVAGPLRTSSLRSLGAYLNTFAGESFMDELAEAAGADPLEFRLRHLSDPRARTVLEVAAERAGYQPHVGPSGRGQGLALCRYKNVRAYVALVVDAAVDTTTGQIAVRRIVLACDAGGVVNPDGLRNQLEGGLLQGLSRALRERVEYDRAGIRTRDWTTYPTLRFSDVPEVDIVLVDRRRHAPLGAGESSTPPLPAALANAVDDAVGIRVRDLPLTPQRLQQRLMDMSEQEMARVRL